MFSGAGMELEALRALTRIADRPGAAIDFPQDVFDERLIVHNFDILEHFISKSQFFGSLYKMT